MTTITRLNKHFIKKAEVNGDALSALWEVINNPAITYGSFEKDARGNRVPRCCRRHGQQQEKWTGTTSTGQKFCIAVNVCCGEAITYWVDQTETELRADQKAAGVTGYRGRDGKWRA